MQHSLFAAKSTPLDEETQWLLRFIQVQNSANLSIAAVMALIATLAAQMHVWAIVVGLLIVVLTNLLAQPHIRRGAMQQAMLIGGVGLVAAAVIEVIYLPQVLVAFAILPITIVALSIAIVPTPILRRLLYGGVLALLAMAVLTWLWPWPRPEVHPLVPILLSLHIGVFTLWLLYHHHLRQRLLLQQSQQAHTRLSTAYADLEATVRRRTARLRESEARYRAVTELVSDYTFS